MKMSKYTTELRYIIEEKGKPPEGSTILQKIQLAAPLIFHFDYPIWDESDRLMLETMILQKYYMREIAFETVGLWEFYLQQKMMEIMPYYVELYKTTQKQYNFLAPYEFSETYTDEGRRENHTTGTDSTTGGNEIHTVGEGSNTQDSTSNNTSTETPNTKTLNITSDLPQATLSANNVDYATTSSSQEHTGTTNQTTEQTTKLTDNSNTNQTTTDQHQDSHNSQADYNESFIHEHTIKRSGNMGHTYSELLEQYRKSILMIPPLIVKDCSDLFFALW